MDEIKIYDPLECLEAEVKRFRETNTFTPLYVTGFYIQAGCVISEIRELRKENEHLRMVLDRQTSILRRWGKWACAHGHDIGVLDDTRELLKSDGSKLPNV